MVLSRGAAVPAFLLAAACASVLPWTSAAPIVSLRRPDDLYAYGDNDIVIVLMVPSYPVEASLEESGPQSSWWTYPFMANVALEAFREQMVLEPPQAWSGYNFHIIHADTCPGSHTECTDFFAMDSVMTHFLPAELPHPFPRAAVGGAHRGLPTAQLLSALRVPTVGHFMGFDSLDVKEEFPFFARANPPDARKFQAIVEIMLSLNYTQGVMWLGNSTFHTDMRTVTLREAREASESSSITINTIQISDRPQNALPPGLEDERYEEWSNAVRNAREYNAHFHIYAFTSTMPYMEFLSFLHINGLIGAGYLWVSEFPLLDAHDQFQALVAANAPESPYANIVPIDGMVFPVESRIGPKAADLTSYIKSLQTREDVLESWIRDKIDPSVWDNPLEFPEDPQILFDAVWSVLMALNGLLLENGGNGFSNEVLLERIVSTEFEGVSGKIGFDSQFSRIVEGPIVQYQNPCGANRTIGEHVSMGYWQSTPEYGAMVSIYRERMRMFGCGTELPPDQDKVCSAGSYYNRTHGACYLCPLGTSTALEGESSCSPCQAGTFSSILGSTACIACNKGNFSSQSGAVTCEPCQPGRFQEDVQQSECRSCPRGQFTDELGVTRCQMCSRGTYASEEASVVCIDCDGERSTKFSGSTSGAECVCPEGMVTTDNSITCTLCTVGLECPFGASLADWFNFEENSTADRYYPRLLPGFWASAADPLNVFSCENGDRCPGGDPGTCGLGLLGSQACEHCPDRQHWSGKECSECKIQDGSRALFPWVPVIVTPAAFLILYACGGGDYASWRSWTRSMVSFAFVLLNHVQVVALLAQANVELPRHTRDTGKVWEWTIEWLSIFKLECAGYKGVSYGMGFQTAAPVFLFVWCVAIYAFSTVLATVTGRSDWQMKAAQAFDVFMSIIFSFFNAIAAMSLTLYKCQDNPNGTSSLKLDLSVVCYEDETWKSLLGLAFVAVLIYCVGCGVLFVWATLRAVEHFPDDNFRTAWKFLFIRYRMDTWWWSLSFLAKGVFLNMCLVITPDGLHQLYMLMGVTCIYTLAVVGFMPYRVWYANHLEVLSGFSIILVSSIMTNFAEKNATHREELDTSSVFVAWAPFGLALVLGAIVVYRQFVLKKGSTEELSPIRQALIKRVREAFNIIATLDAEDIADFLSFIDEPDRHAVRQALAVIESEVLGVKHWRLNARKMSIKQISEKRRSRTFTADSQVSAV